MVAGELLLRLVGSDGRVVLPGPYLEAAEHCRLAVQVDTWVLDRAARMAASGRRLHVNLSRRTVVENGFAARIEGAIARHGVDPSLLTFEIAETAPVLERSFAGSVPQRIARLGSGLALDSFGTGYGALTHLLHVPVMMLKIDREFVIEVAGDPRSRAIVEAIVDIARRLGQTTVAEGVEGAAALAVLRECGVDLAQGFHFGHLSPA
jgi:EAL domain-containing protein (putative c-di-GMP-specific phosphodiesterase class I)